MIQKKLLLGLVILCLTSKSFGQELIPPTNSPAQKIQNAPNAPPSSINIPTPVTDLPEVTSNNRGGLASPTTNTTPSTSTGNSPVPSTPANPGCKSCTPNAKGTNTQPQPGFVRSVYQNRIVFPARKALDSHLYGDYGFDVPYGTSNAYNHSLFIFGSSRQFFGDIYGYPRVQVFPPYTNPRHQ